jgi:hypothetical protein
LRHAPRAYTAEARGRRTIAPMKILSLIHVTVAQAFYRWAMREINPLHPDLPRIMLRQQELADKARRMFA